MAASLRVPPWIAALFAMNLLVVLAPAIDFWLGTPYSVVRRALNLDSEQSGPAWYSAILWFVAGAQFGLVAIAARRQEGRLPRIQAMFAPLAGFALLCVVFSAEEIVGIHEWIGRKSDALLPGGDRKNIALWRTGVWPLVLGIPVVALLAVLVVRMRRLFEPSRRAFRLLAIGLAIMFTGALAVELTANMIHIAEQARGLVLFQRICEEFLEMTGATFVVWSAYELLYDYGFRLVTPDLKAVLDDDDVKLPARPVLTDS